MAIEGYIRTAVNGDAGEIVNFVTKPPPSYFIDCVSTEVPDEDSGPKLVMKRDEFAPRPSPRSSGRDPFYELSISDRPDRDSFEEAMWVYSYRTNLRDYRVIHSLVLGDEAIVELEYRLTDSQTFRTSYYLFRENGWRVFSGLRPEVATLLAKHNTVNHNYAKTRPPCVDPDAAYSAPKVSPRKTD